MSAIAEFYKLDKAKAEELRRASKPEKRFLGRPKDRYFEFLKTQAQALREYDWSGYVYATLLPYLDERGMKLMDSGREYDEMSTFLTEARSATHFIFTTDHKERYLNSLKPSNFEKEELRKYYEEFCEEEWPEAGDAMLDGIETLYENLKEVDDDSIIVFAVF